jgi:hypothetical protein
VSNNLQADMPRYLADSLIFLAAIVAPWWLTIPVAAMFALRYKSYYELIALGVILDALYGVPLSVLYGRAMIFSISCSLIFMVAEFLKPQLRLVPART